MSDSNVKKKKKPNKWVQVGGSGIHQTGLFAKRGIPKGQRLIEYVGEKVPRQEGQRRGHEQDALGRASGEGTVYIFTLNSRYDIDGAKEDNDARYINHSCDPNSYVEVKKNRIWIYALRDIEKGEEICYDYNFDAGQYEDYPCRCGSKNCSGFIVGKEHRKELKKMIKAKEKNQRKKKKST